MQLAVETMPGMSELSSPSRSSLLTCKPRHGEVKARIAQLAPHYYKSRLPPFKGGNVVGAAVHHQTTHWLSKLHAATPG